MFDEFNSRNQYSLSIDCLNLGNNLFGHNSSKTNLIIRFLNQSNSPNDLFDNFLKDIEYKLSQSNCLSSDRTHVLLWNNLSDQTRQDDSILFNKINGLNIIIDIHHLSSKSFDYDILIEMPQEKSFLEKLETRLDISFLQRHQHPSEQIVT